MSKTITLERVDDVPADSRVCHYDELGERAKAELPSLTESTDDAVESAVAEGFHTCDLVKYTDYYEVSVH
ncbi:hypothetical protein D8Y22_05200 [Salinadaptatus halalkaliphilus]|uniref:DUF7979 domain-containing protein n=1 Tax=Salinadaptatus halalkaliphilus TaxID=2419781 RepID=A0A4S3TQH3_9EURY|nr:hypothetical protein [Salinadaptatus halalkaliphilus]THE65920.1 hypothetical protein D8Y22_05200 [Salinadaptatus halalkaliphilus]